MILALIFSVFISMQFHDIVDTPISMKTAFVMSFVIFWKIVALISVLHALGK